MSDFREEGDDALNALVLQLDKGAGPARRISRERSAQMVMAALEAGALVSQPAPRPRGKRPPVWLMTGALLVAGAAAAAVWSFTRPDREGTAQVDEAALTGPLRLEMESRQRNGMPVDPASSRLDSVPAEVLAVAAEAPEPVRPRVSSSTGKVAAPEDLLLKANGLRSEGRWKEAEALYLRVIRAEPSSLASYVANVASGSLRLEHLGDPRGALRQFKAALRIQPRGVLDQEAQHGIAEAHRVLGNRDAERSALESFLSTHPDSPLVPSVRARVRELVAP